MPDIDRPDGVCEVRTTEPWLTVSWIQRSVRELLELVRADKGADSVETLHDSTIQPGTYRTQSIPTIT